MLTWKYCIGYLVYFGDFVLGLLARGKGAGVAGFWMYGDGVSCAVFGGLVSGVLISSVCSAGGEVSSGAVDSRRAVGVDLVVGGDV